MSPSRLKRKANDSARGARLTAAMIASGRMYNCQLCYDLGVTESSLSRWRSGGPMSVAMAVGLAQHLGVSLEWLVAGRTGLDSPELEWAGETREAARLFAMLPTSNRLLVLVLTQALLEHEMAKGAA